jgi:adenine-specific DNA-methyltransferase
LIYVGIVSGKEEVYKNNELGNISVLNGEDKIDRYIYIEEYNQILIYHNF